MQKNRHLGTIAQLRRAISSQLRHLSTIGKKFVKQQYLPRMFLQYGELRPTSSWDRFVCTPANFNGFRVLAALLHSHTAALNRRRHLYLAGRPSRWALAHISSLRVSSAGVPLAVNCTYCRCGDKLFTGAVWPWFCVLWAWISVDSSALWSDFPCWTLGKWMLSGTAARSSLSFWNFLTDVTVPSVLWHCWLGIRKSIQPAKKFSDEVLMWLSVWSEVQILCIWSS